MKDINLRITELKKCIEDITLYINDQMILDDFDLLEAKLTERINLISELISLQSVGGDKEELIHFLKAIKEHDAKLVIAAKERREEIKKSLLNINNLKKYAMA